VTLAADVPAATLGLLMTALDPCVPYSVVTAGDVLPALANRVAAQPHRVGGARGDA